MNVSSFLQADAKSPQFTTVSGPLSESILKAWQFHLDADFDAADRIFEGEFKRRPSAEVGACWGLSLRYRGDCHRAVGILREVWELAKYSEDSVFQLEACCQLMLCYRDLSDAIGRDQFRQLAIRLALGSREFQGFPEVVQLELDRDAGRMECSPPNNYLRKGFGQHNSFEVDAERCHLRAESAFRAKDFRIASQEWGSAAEQYLRIGHFQGAISVLERNCESLLAGGHWAEAIMALSVMQRQAQTLKMLAKSKEASRWKGKIQRAMQLLQPASTCLN